jgi:hypothetical protein
MTYDFNSAGPQRSFEVIPDGTLVVVEMNIRTGGAGEGGLFKRSKNGEAEGIDAEFVVVDGEYTKRKLWSFMVVSGTTDGHAQAADITTRTLRAILESARGIKPTDASEAAKEMRKAAYADFDGLRFMVKVGVEPAANGYKAKNILSDVITPDRKEWHPVEQEPKPSTPGGGAEAPTSPSASATPITKPAWAQ